MSQPSAFHIYDASAGSGKTFNLVRIFLRKLLQAPDPSHFRQILAITFTNKAVGEMKNRIVEGLISCASDEVLTKPDHLSRYLLDDTGMAPAELQTKSKAILDSLLQHYGAFSVETIDGFNHRLIRTFARDLRIPSLFEVELETKQLIAEAVDRLIALAGVDKGVTDVLMDYALEKTEDDKSWDVSRDLRKTGGMLANENHHTYLAPYLSAQLQELIDLKQLLSGRQNELKSQATAIAQAFTTVFQNEGLDKSHFKGGHLYNWFQNLAGGRMDQNFGQKWQKELGVELPYAKTIDPAKAAKVDALVPEIRDSLSKLRYLTGHYLLLENALSQYTPLSVINLIEQQVQEMKNEQGVLPIYEFNRIIQKAIKGQPAPFLYERLGNRYQHFMIDEFQDTSVMQWTNMEPLIDNALSQDDGSGDTSSLLLVGDAKQSIYRWRGGRPEQFISLCNQTKSPFAHERQLISLGTNYRSLDKIVDFNNDFFTYTAKTLRNPAYAELYERGNKQQTHKGEGGYVTIRLIDGEPKAEEKDSVYCEEVLSRVELCLSQGYNQGEICVLTRVRKEGAQVAAQLLEKGYDVVSADSLLLAESTDVQMLIELLRSVLHPDDNELRFAWLTLLYDRLESSLDLHDFLEAGVASRSSAEQLLAKHEIVLDLEELFHLPLYGFFERCIQKLGVDRTADGFLIGLMDVVQEFSNKPLPTKLNFLRYWEEKKDSLSVSGAAGNSIKVMTIHKAKGLEFPVVIFPWINREYYKEIDPAAWIEDGQHPPFSHLLIRPSKKTADWGENGAAFIKEYHDQLQLDQINLLYVVFTRAIEQLHLISEQVDDVNNNINSFQLLICSFLDHKALWNPDTFLYEFGVPHQPIEQLEAQPSAPIAYSSHPLNFDRLFTVSGKAELWKRDGESAVSLGNSLHELLAKVITEQDVDSVLAYLDTSDEELPVKPEQMDAWVRELVHAPETSAFFDGTDQVLCEKEIIVPGRPSVRPDRVNLHPDGSATVIDYKTGEYREYYKEQVSNYANTLEDMGIRIRSCLLIYFSEQGISVNKV